MNVKLVYHEDLVGVYRYVIRLLASPTEVLSGIALTTEGAPHGACLNA